MAKPTKDDTTLKYGVKTMRKHSTITPEESESQRADHESRVAHYERRLKEGGKMTGRRLDKCGPKGCKAKPRKIKPNLSPAEMAFGYTSPSSLRQEWDTLQAKKKRVGDCPKGKAGNTCRTKTKAHNARLQKRINALKAKGGGGTKPCAGILDKQRCPVQLYFDKGTPKLRFCVANNKRGRVVSFKSRAQAAAEARRICACWKKNNGARGWDKKCSIGAAPLGSTRKRRRG
jgi:hypothetical protein